MHFVGIAGVGMSGLAELMRSRGHLVSGCDLAGGRVADHLSDLGIDVRLGHSAEHAHDADVVVYSSAIDSQHPELVEARRRGIPVVHRSEMLAEAMQGMRGIAIAGTHGKTTTTALVTHVLVATGLDPTALVGGWVNQSSGAAGGTVIGRSDWLVTEADESDGSFLRLPSCINVVTNVDADHLDHYGDMNALEAAFVRFANSVASSGVAIVCTDHPRTRGLAEQATGRVLRYAVEGEAELVARDVTTSATGMRFEVEHEGTRLGEIRLPLPGRHNVANALAALGVALELDVSFSQAAEALASFRGVARRFENIGTARGVTVVDDYGHHPVEVRATLEAARAFHTGRIVVIFQPHRFTRTRDCMSEFSGAFGNCDVLIVTSTYAAGEAPIEGAQASALTRAIAKSGHPDVRYVDQLSGIAESLPEALQEGDLVITLGAGDITRLGPELLERLREGEPS